MRRQHLLVDRSFNDLGLGVINFNGEGASNWQYQIHPPACGRNKFLLAYKNEHQYLPYSFFSTRDFQIENMSSHGNMAYKTSQFQKLCGVYVRRHSFLSVVISY